MGTGNRGKSVTAGDSGCGLPLLVAIAALVLFAVAVDSLAAAPLPGAAAPCLACSAEGMNNEFQNVQGPPLHASADAPAKFLHKPLGRRCFTEA